LKEKSKKCLIQSTKKLNQDCFTQNQVSKIYKEIKTGKASGDDKIDNEMLKYAICAELITILTRDFRQN
jgi:hypothetical protein